MRPTTLTRHAGMFAAGLMLAFAARAGQFEEAKGVAIGGYDPVAYFTQHAAVEGKSEFHASYLGSEFHFVSAHDRDLFAADPARYAPQYHGFCVYGTAHGEKAPTDPHAFDVVNDRLYLNYNLAVRDKFRTDVPGMIRQADANWPKVETQKLEQ